VFYYSRFQSATHILNEFAERLPRKCASNVWETKINHKFPPCSITSVHQSDADFDVYLRAPKKFANSVGANTLAKHLQSNPGPIEWQAIWNCSCDLISCYFYAVWAKKCLRWIFSVYINIIVRNYSWFSFFKVFVISCQKFGLNVQQCAKSLKILFLSLGPFPLMALLYWVQKICVQRCVAPRTVKDAAPADSK
jgi:hypothetical protein